MRLTGLYSARETMIVQGGAISTVADNVANINTPGFKSARAEFSDIFAASMGSLYGSDQDAGNGVQLSDLSINFDKQGSLNPTERALDAGISGRGFFILGDVNDAYYTRAGNFGISETGDLISEQRRAVLGYTEESPETLTALNVNSISGKAVPTSSIKIGGNLNSAAAVSVPPAGAATFEAASAGSILNAPTRIIDSLGAEHDVSLYFYRTAGATPSFAVQAYVDGAETGGVAGTPTLIGTGTITMGADGKQAAAGTPLALNVNWGNGATATAATLDLSGFTGFAGNSSLSTVSADGSKAGNPASYEISDDGTFNVVLDTGDRVKIGTIALASFINPNGLDRVGSNEYRASAEAGDVAVGVPGTEGRGKTVGSRLETSTTDMPSEFIDMIRYQRAYQAGSQVLSTISQLLNTTIQIR